MRKKRLLVALAVAGAAFGVAGAVQASIPDSNGVAHGCYYVPPKLGGTQQRPGDLRLIDTDKGQQCASDEQSVDLATTGFVTSNVNQTTFTERYTYTFPSAGEWTTLFYCPIGYVAVDPQLQAPQYFGDNARFTVRSAANGGNSWYNQGTVVGQPPNNTADIYVNISGTTATGTISEMVTCVDGRVYGEAGPSGPVSSSDGKVINKPVS